MVFKISTSPYWSAQAAYAKMAKEDVTDYQQVKAAILKRYSINKETYRQRFREARLKQNETHGKYSGFVYQLAHSDTCKVNDLADTLIREHFTELVTSLGSREETNYTS